MKPESLAVHHGLLKSMTRIRIVEEEIARRYKEQEMRCPVHLSIGQEAVAVGVCSVLGKGDWVFSGHRNHAHYLAKGGNLKGMIAEIYGRVTGCCGGRGGSMHLTDQACGFIGATPIVGSTVPIAVGASLTAKNEGAGRTVVVFLGDGAMETGVVNESLNFAAVRKLPILFVCENNLYSVYSPLDVRQPKGRSIAEVAKGHGLAVAHADGNDAWGVREVAGTALSDIKKGKGPVFLELSTYRWREHCGPNYDNSLGYRTEEEFEEWKERDPIEKMKQNWLVELSTSEIESIRVEVDDAFVSARKAPFAVETSSNKVYAKTIQRDSSISKRGSRVISYADAIREAQEESLSCNDTCYLMGLGVPDPKGIFGTTLGLQEKYGSDRVFDIPLSENALTGVAIGSAVTGMRPILTHQRLDFALVSIDQIVNQAAKWYYMFNSTMSVPMVIRMIVGRGWGQGPQHSQSLHAWFAHIPGLKVVMPSDAFDAKGMLNAAVEDNNPVILIEHRWLHETTGYVPEQRYYVDLEKAAVKRAGTDITLVGVSYMTLECAKAAEILHELGISVEVIDLRSVNPLDYETILSSAGKTRRLLVVDHADGVCGIASEIIASVSEAMGLSMLSNPEKMCLPNHPVPTSHMSAKSYYPVADDIVSRVMAMFGMDWEASASYNSESPRDQPSVEFKGPF